MQRTVAFGLRWDSDIPLHQFEVCAHDGVPADVIIRQIHAPLRPRQVVVAIDNAELCTDGVRYRAGHEVTFDTIGANRVEWMAGEAWAGTVPAVFFSTVTALLLAWRGYVPVHGSAVEIGGKAVLICGKAGAGKSTLAAGLIALGARLISDDLSVLQPQGPRERPVLYAGRPATRLFPAVAGFLKDAVATREFRALANDKCIVLPPRVAPLRPIPLAVMVVLGREPTPIAPSQRAPLLHAQLFRPRWMRSVPGSTERSAAIQDAARDLRVVSMPSADIRDAGPFMSRATMTLEEVRQSLD